MYTQAQFTAAAEKQLNSAGTRFVGDESDTAKAERETALVYAVLALATAVANL